MSGASNGVAVYDKVREAIEAAKENNQRLPSQGDLVKLTGTSRHHVRKALAQLSPPTTPDPASSGGETPPAHPPGAHLAPPGEPAANQPHQRRPWTLILIAVAAAVAVWGGWVDIGKLTGFGMVQPLPGLVDSLWINTAIVLPIGIEAYGGYALRTWLSSAALSKRTRSYARWSAWLSLAVGAGAQVASHLLRVAGVTAAPWQVTLLVSCVPVVVLGLAIGLTVLVRQDTTLAEGGR
jgi:hypothetical protein